MRGYFVRLDDSAFPPVLKLNLHHAPHKRMHRRALQQYREDILDSARRSISAQTDLPIDYPIDLEVLYVNPSSPDLDHLLEATFMAIDGKSLKGPSILKDDRLIQKVTMSKFYHSRSKRDGEQ